LTEPPSRWNLLEIPRSGKSAFNLPICCQN